MRPTVPRSILLAAASMTALTACTGQQAGETGTAAPTETVTTTKTATATVTVSPSASPRSTDCRKVAFEPNTDAGAFDIRASGVGCPLARQVARAAEGQGGDAYDTTGFHCRPTGTVGQLPSVVYACAGDSGGRVGFRAS